MKHLYTFIMAILLSSFSHASQKDYKLNITNDGVIIHDQKDWHFVVESDDYDIYIEKGMLGAKQEIVRFHAFVPYHTPEKMFGSSVPVKALYVYGSLHCGKQQLMLLIDTYVDEINKIIFRNSYEVNTNIVSLNVPNTTRFDILNLVCKESI
jgi:hypothetical protein